MNKKKEPLRLEIALDGSRAALYEGQLLVYGFKWKEKDRGFEIIAINKHYEDLMLRNPTMYWHLNTVLEHLNLYKKEADRLTSLKKGLEEADSLGPLFEIIKG